MLKNTIKLSLISAALLSQLNALESINLEEIIVTSATKSKQSIKDVTSNVNVITAQEIEERHYSDVVEALNTLPGVSFTSNGSIGSSQSMSIRGSDNKSVLVLIDGVKYNDYSGISGAPMEHLMISDIERIEVVKGAQSGIWGADASAGVINIITKQAKDGVHASLNAEAGSFDTKKYGAGISYKTDDYYIKLNLQKVTSDGFSSYAQRDADIDSYEDDAYSNKTWAVDAGFKIDDANKIDIKHKNISSHKETDSSSSDNLVNYTDAVYKISSINFNHIGSFLTENENELNLYLRDSKTSRDIMISGTEYDGGLREYGLNSTIKYNGDDFVILGAEHGSYERLNDVNKKYISKSVFVTNSNKINDTIITESLRYDKYSIFDSELTGKIGIKHNFQEDLSASFNYATAYNVPTVTHLWAPTLYGFIPYGNENLTPEKAKSYDLCISYKNFSATAFYNEIKDYIYYRYEGGTYYGYSNKEGTSKFKGIELEYKQNIGEDTLLSLNYTRQSAKDENNEEYKRIPKDSVKFGLDYYGITNLHLGLSGEYIGERFDDDNRGGEQTGRYVLANMSANYDINKHLLIYAKIDNLFDKYYQVVDGYATSPRSVYVGFKAKF